MKTRKTKKKKEEMLLELEGHVNIVEKRNGRVVSRERLDDDVILKVLLHFVERALENAIVEYELREKHARPT